MAAVAQGVAAVRMASAQAVNSQEPLAPLGERIEDISELDLEQLLAAPMVESASRRRQSLEEAPGAITVIEGADLPTAGPLTLAEALRTVPGAWVFQTDANSFHLGLRGSDDSTNSAMLILVNGRRFFDLTAHGAPWQVLGINVNEIERIEILRGPGATLYGADAFNGVINIVTKRPTDHPGAEGAFVVGSNLVPRDPAGLDRMNNFGRGYVAGNYRRPDGKLGARASLGFSHLAEWQPNPEPQPGQKLYRDGPVASSASLALDWIPTPDFQVLTEVRHAVSEAQTTFDAFRAVPVLWEEQSATVTLEKKRFLIEHLTLKVNADARRMEQGTTLLGTDGDDFPMNATYRLMAQGDLEFLDGRNVLTAGVDGSYRDSWQVFGQKWNAVYGGVYLQDEMAFFDRRLLINVAGRYEGIQTESSDGAGARYINFNPRLSIIGRLGEYHTVRLSTATSYRTPPPFFTLVEAVITPYPAPIPPAYAVARNPLMRPEKLRALEAGYRGRLAYWLRLDGTVFVQGASNVRETLIPRVPLESTNSLDETHVGCELALQLRPSETIAGHLSYAFLRADSREYPDDVIRFPPHILSLGARGNFAGKLLARADFNYVAGIRSRGVGFDPTGTVLALNTYSASAQAIVNLRLGYRVKPGTELFAMGTNVLAPLRARESLRQALRPEGARIGAVFMIGMELKPQ